MTQMSEGKNGKFMEWIRVSVYFCWDGRVMHTAHVNIIEVSARYFMVLLCVYAVLDIKYRTSPNKRAGHGGWKWSLNLVWFQWHWLCVLQNTSTLSAEKVIEVSLSKQARLFGKMRYIDLPFSLIFYTIPFRSAPSKKSPPSYAASRQSDRRRNLASGGDSPFPECSSSIPESPYCSDRSSDEKR